MSDATGSVFRPEERARLAGHGARAAATPIRGRDDLLRRIDAAVDTVASGRAALIAVTGSPGMGKTRMLQHVLDRAAAHGWRRVIVAPDVDSIGIPLGAIVDAIVSADPPLLEGENAWAVRAGAQAEYWLTMLLADALEKAAMAGGVLIAVDDLQWADTATLSMLATLIEATADMPVAWAFATRPGDSRAAHRRLLDTAAGAQGSFELVALNHAATDLITHDVFGAAPGPRLAQALAATSGVPLLVAELLHGLRDENLASPSGGLVESADEIDPSRFASSSRARILALSPAARQLAQVGALFGRDFRLGSALAVLGSSPGEMIAAVTELLEHHIVSDGDGILAFTHDTLREAAAGSLPSSLEHELSRGVTRQRLLDGEPATAVAGAVALWAHPGDPEAVEILHDAALALATTNAQQAAALAAEAARLAGTNHAFTAALLDLLPLLWAGGRGDLVTAISERIGPTLDHEGRGTLAVRIARLHTESSFSDAIEICRRALSLPGLTPTTRAQLSALLALNTANAARFDALADAITDARAAAVEAADDASLATVDATDSVYQFNQFRFDRAHDLMEHALAQLARTGMRRAEWMPEGLWGTFMRNSLGECDIALEMADEGLAAARSARNIIAEAYWMMVRSRVLYDAGMLDEAATLAEAVLDLSATLGLGDFANATAGIVLFRIGVHRGDTPLVQRMRPVLQAMADGAGLSFAGRWALAWEAHDAGRSTEAYTLASAGLDAIAEPVPSLTTPMDMADDITLIGILLNARRFEQLPAIADRATRRAEANPDNALAPAIAALVAGVQERDEAGILNAVETLRHIPRPMVLAHALESLHLVAVDDEIATRALLEALEIYELRGATRDASRVLRGLRLRGVHKRLATPSEEGLSAREQQVLEQLATGATTKEVAERLYLSPHTVVTHVRHIYAKLGVTSRRELLEYLGDGKR